MTFSPRLFKVNNGMRAIYISLSVGRLVNCLLISRALAQYEFYIPQNLGAILNSASMDGTIGMTADGLTMFVDTNRPGGFGGSSGDYTCASYWMLNK